ncbi:unnamed protein product, partial [Rotaria sordida]
KNARNSLTQISHGQRQKKSLPVRQQIPRRRGTISTASVLHSNNNLNENVPKKQYSLRKNHSFTYVTNENISTSTFNKSSRNSFIPHITEPPPPLPYAEKNARNS